MGRVNLIGGSVPAPETDLKQTRARTRLISAPLEAEGPYTALSFEAPAASASTHADD
jgi:hypothetical protein